MSDSLRPQGLYSPWSSLGQNTGVSSLSLQQGIFPTKGLNPGLPHCRQILYKLSHQGSPRILVAYPFSRGSFQPRNWTRVSCLAGRFFTNWSMREALCGDRRGNSNLMWSNCKWTLQWKMAGVRESARICSFVLVPIVHNTEVQLFSEHRLHVLAQISGWHLWFLAAQHSVQFSRSVMSFSLLSYGLQHTRFPCPSSTPEACSNSCPSSQWCYVILCHPLLFLPSVFPSIRVFSSESALHIGLPKYWINQVLFYEDHHKHLSAFLSPAGAYANLDNITPKVHQPWRCLGPPLSFFLLPHLPFLLLLVPCVLMYQVTL